MKLVRSVLLGESMRPLIRHGDTVFRDESFPFEQVQVGHTIAWQSSRSPHPTVHRVMWRWEGTRRRYGIFGPKIPVIELVTRGINNPDRDEDIVTRKNYLGRVVRIFRPSVGVVEIP
jgi:hypothetical protein